MLTKSATVAGLTRIYSPLMAPAHVMELFLISDGQMVRDQAGTHMAPPAVDKKERMRVKQLEVTGSQSVVVFLLITNAFSVMING